MDACARSVLKDDSNKAVPRTCNTDTAASGVWGNQWETQKNTTSYFNNTVGPAQTLGASVCGAAWVVGWGCGRRLVYR
eukprot:scaffold11332_cov65-Phaeocystis_antarctica.AAC.5